MLLQSFAIYAQFVEFGSLHKDFPTHNSIQKPNQRIGTSLILPFWDDFSQGLDTLKWKLQGVSYSETAGINAPSIGMVVFNGADQNGKPYSKEASDQGESDFLTSQPINLSGILPSEKETLYLSFFWQAGGKSEAPDQNDRFTVQILDPSGNWQHVWSTKGGEELDRSRFFLEILEIKPEWQHSAFQFRFFSNGRKSGPFDAWLLDYVYLNMNRSKSSSYFPDRTLTQTNSVKLGDFGAYPWELLEKNQSGKWSVVKNEFLNLENRFRAMEYAVSVLDSAGNTLLSINSKTPFNPVPNVLERRFFQSRTFEKIPLPNKPGDVFFTTQLTSGDGLLFEVNQGDTTRYGSVDFRSNDRITSRFPIRDFFSYDFGSADYAAGINQRSGQLAVKYSTPEAVFLKGISIYFSNALQVNQAIDVVVWNKLDAKPLLTIPSVIPERLPGQEFVYFPLEEPLQINGDFYIGFTQFSNDFIHIGLDKSNDQGNKIFYNVGGGWIQNDQVKGALMIRPHVSKSSKQGTGNQNNTIHRLYPNPVVDELTVEGEFTKVWIVDSFGRQILLPNYSTDRGQIINFENQKPGIYVVNLLTNEGLKSIRILVKN